MPTNPYGYMQLLRLSQATGKVLTRLNVMPGQILHGRVYRMEPYGQTGETVNAGSDSGGIAKIALASHLIEAVVSKSLPEGARVTLEVLELADESFVLRLLAVEASKSANDKGQLSDVSKSATSATKPDLAELSALALESAGRPAGEIADQLSLKLVETPKWAELPKPVANVLRAAISENFINPENFTLRASDIKSAIVNALTALRADIAKLGQTAPSSAKELTASLTSLADMVGDSVNSLPATDISMTGSATALADAMKALSGALRALGLSTGSPPDSARVSAETGQRVEPTETGEAQSTSQSALTAKGADVVTTSAKPGAGTSPSSAPASELPPGMEGPRPPALPADPSLIPAAQIGKQVAPQGTTLPGVVQSTVPVESESTAATVSADAGKESDRGGSNPSRDILFGIRVLAALAERVARTGRWQVEESATIAAHASRLTTLADAFEGALIAPLLTHAADVPDMVPRLLLSLLFPGGNAQLVILQSDKDREGSPEKGARDRGEGGEENRCIGIISVRTQALGEIRAKLEYREIEEDSRAVSAPSVSGLFRAVGETADEIRTSVPTLERALEARGIESDGFRVTALQVRTDEPKADDKPRSKKSEGGLDIRI